MQTPAIIASLTVVGSIAYATGQGGSGKQPPLMPIGSQAHSMQEEMPQARMQMASGCTQGADKNWFTTVHWLASDCLPPSDQVFDLNGDGKREILFNEQYYLLRWGTQLEFCFCGLNEVHGGGELLEVENSCIIHSSTVMQLVRPKFTFEPIEIQAYWGVRDLDGDEDQDLIVYCQGTPDYQTYQRVGFWFENTGFQHTNPIAADLNRDGQVDGADLGLLLVSWGQTQ